MQAAYSPTLAPEGTRKDRAPQLCFSTRLAFNLQEADQSAGKGRSASKLLAIRSARKPFDGRELEGLHAQRPRGFYVD